SPDFDGIAIQSFESMDDFRAFLAAPEVAEKLGPDGPKFMDQQASVWIMTDSPMVFVGKDPVGEGAEHGVLSAVALDRAGPHAPTGDHGRGGGLHRHRVQRPHDLPGEA